MNVYSIGNHNLGISLVFRNITKVGMKHFPIRRYFRFIIKVLGLVFTFEIRFRNSL